MQRLPAVIRAIDGFTERFGRLVSWLTLGTVLVCFAVVVLRYVFSIGSICLQELYVWQHALVFMLGAGYTLMHGGHVRVDLLYVRMSVRRRAWVDLFGTVFFLAPWLFVLVWFGWPFLARSWSLFEASGQAGGCQGYFILKSAIVLFAAVVAIQGLALFCRSLLVLLGRPEFAPVRDTGKEPV
ncbi:MAG: TRAP transporter small permease subunit [Rhodospirillaceae bacterium]|nr:TRAP transporter small permease subunit [Rhodospirillaceae bacterium]